MSYGSVPAALAPALGVPNAPGVVAKEEGFGKFRRTVLVFKDFVVPLVDNAGVGGQAATKVYDFPVDAALFKGGIVDLTVKGVNPDGTAGISAVFTGIVGLGTATGVAATLTGTEQDLVPSTVIAAAVASQATAQAVSTSTEAGKVIAGGVGAKAAFLNVLIDDAFQDESVHAANLVLNGTVRFNWDIIGNYGQAAQA